MNAKLVGRPAIEIAQEAGFNVPADTKLIIWGSHFNQKYQNH